MGNVDYKNVTIGVLIILLLGAVGYMLFKPQKVVVLDIETVVSTYEKAANIEKDIVAKQGELAAFLEQAKVEINKGKTTQEKAALDQKYTEQYNQKATDLMNYSKKEVDEVRNDISAAAQKVAQKKAGTKVVFEKKAVIAGDIDITEEVKAELNKNK